MPSVPPQSLAPDTKPQPLEAAKRGISARAKARLINAALNEHPFVIEIFRTYDAFTKFKTGIIQWLEGQGMVNEVGSLENIKTLQLNKVRFMEKLQVRKELLWQNFQGITLDFKNTQWLSSKEKHFWGILLVSVHSENRI